MPIAVSAFAAYGSAYVLFVNLFLLPIFLLRKDWITPILSFTFAILSYWYILSILPVDKEVSISETLHITFSDQVKIDGGKLKGFGKTHTGETVYVLYSFEDEQEKNRFMHTHLPSYQFAFTGSYKEPAIPSHAYSFDMGKYLRMNGAVGQFEAQQLVGVNNRSGMMQMLSLQRWRVKQHIEKVFPESLQVEAEALLIGDRSGMDEAAAQRYRTLGITHLFAISGLHVGLLTMMIRYLLIRLSVRIETVDTLMIILLPLYAVIAGGAPSVWRAVSVTIILLLTATGKVKMRMDDALSISAAVFILYEPFVLFQPGFQLSYLAAFSLIYSSDILSQSSSVLRNSFLVTFITQLALCPVLLYHFYEISLSSFIVNLLFVPLYSFVILPANIFLLFLSYALPFIANMLFLLYTPFREWIDKLTIFLSDLPYQMWTPGRPSTILLIISFFCLITFFVSFEKQQKVFPAIIWIVIPVLLIAAQPYTDRSLRVTFLDVGQGDSIIIELPNRKGVYVIDTGGRVTFGEPNWKTPNHQFEIGRNIVVPFLKGKGITKIDKLLLTHADSDHIEGADEVMEELKIKEIHISPESSQEPTMKDVIRISEEKGIPIRPMKEGNAWKLLDIDFIYLSPPNGNYNGNDSSLVLYMRTGDVSFLFTGDLEVEGEKRIIRTYGEIDWGSRLILKAGHHGSRTSSSEPFIEMLSPKLTILSYGRNNRYGHPHAEVINTFDKFDVLTAATAELGSITITVKRGDYYISTSAK